MDETQRRSLHTGKAQLCRKRLQPAARSLGWYALPAAGVFGLLMVHYAVMGLYPFGDKTIAWCDMTQQVIPLLAQLRDILTGKQGLFLNLSGAGGMNLWGVLFFFAASPFSLLVLAWPKAQLVLAVNVITALKLSAAAVTAMYWFRTRQQKLHPALAALLSAGYALCGYGMLYYQNSIWLDELLLFPLLLCGLAVLEETGRIGGFTAALTAMAVVNYYIAFMTAVFLLVYMGIYLARHGREAHAAWVPVQFCAGSGIAALLSAVVWLPCLIQYLGSARGGNVFSNLAWADPFAHLYTVLPQFMTGALALTALAVGVLGGKPRTRRQNTRLILLAVLAASAVVEPVSLMWHGGSYMSFPVRFGFMISFLIAVCAGDFLAQRQPQLNAPGHPAAVVTALGLTALYALWQQGVIKAHWKDITVYTRTLWGSSKSLPLAAALFLVGLALTGGLYLCWRQGWLRLRGFALLAALLLAVQTWGNLSIYVSAPSRENNSRVQTWQAVMELEGRLPAGSTDRVKTSAKLFDVNDLGALGVPALSHYTSLTEKNTLFTQKLYGYSSYWMEVGGYGGTILTDALLGVRYLIRPVQPNTGDTVVYTGTKYEIVDRGPVLPLGILSDESLAGTADLTDLTRTEVQALLYRRLLAGQEDSIVHPYAPTGDDGALLTRTTEGYFIEGIGTLRWEIPVEAEQALYFDAFDALSNALKEPINGSFTVRVNGVTVQKEYPSQRSNGLLYLGTFADQTVTVEVKSNANEVRCASFGVMGIETEGLRRALARAEGVPFTRENGGLTGTVTLDRDRWCVLTLPCQGSLHITVNGKAVQYRPVLGNLVQIALPAGENVIRVTGQPVGFGFSLALTLLGAVLGWVWVRYGQRLCRSARLQLVCIRLLMAGAGLVALAVYLLPMLVNLAALAVAV